MKLKKIFLIVSIFLLTGCNLYYVDNKNIEDLIKISISNTNELYNVNNKGYRYYLPVDFEVYEDKDYNQILLSKGIKYYLNIDVVSYYYRNDNIKEREEDDYEYHTFEHNNIKGYIKIKESDKDKYLIEIYYNYAIIEVNIESKDVKYAITQSIGILSSITYNDLVINKFVGENSVESSETIYQIPSPVEKAKKNVLEYIGENEGK